MNKTNYYAYFKYYRRSEDEIFFVVRQLIELFGVSAVY